MGYSRDDIFLFPYQADGEPEGSPIDGFFANIERTRRAGVELDTRFGIMSGDEANREEPLQDFLPTALRLTFHPGKWELQARVENLFNTRRAAFGTFNCTNRRTIGWSASSRPALHVLWGWCCAGRLRGIDRERSRRPPPSARSAGVHVPIRAAVQHFAP